MSVSTTLRLVSYNCKGWHNGSLLVSDLLKSCDICLVQRHWLLKEQLHNLSIDSDFLSCSVSGMDSSVLLHGHLFGGCAIFLLWVLLVCLKLIQIVAVL